MLARSIRNVFLFLRADLPGTLVRLSAGFWPEFRLLKNDFLQESHNIALQKKNLDRIWAGQNGGNLAFSSSEGTLLSVSLNFTDQIQTASCLPGETNPCPLPFVFKSIIKF